MKRNKTNSLLSPNRVAIQGTISIVTSHCTFDRHVKRLFLNDCCRSCGSEEENKTVFDIHVSIYRSRRKMKQIFHLLLLESLTDFLDIKFATIVKFILSSGWFHLGNIFGVTMDFTGLIGIPFLFI